MPLSPTFLLSGGGQATHWWGGRGESTNTCLFLHRPPGCAHDVRGYVPAWPATATFWAMVMGWGRTLEPPAYRARIFPGLAHPCHAMILMVQQRPIPCHRPSPGPQCAVPVVCLVCLPSLCCRTPRRPPQLDSTTHQRSAAHHITSSHSVSSFFFFYSPTRNVNTPLLAATSTSPPATRGLPAATWTLFVYLLSVL